jgi:hypothetical protein
MCVPPWRRLGRPLCGSRAPLGMLPGPPTMPRTPRIVMPNLTRGGNGSTVGSSGGGLLAYRVSPDLLHLADIGSTRPVTAGDATRAGASRFIGGASRQAAALVPLLACGQGVLVHLLAQEALPRPREVATALDTCGSLATAPPGATAAEPTLIPLQSDLPGCVLAGRSPMASISSSAACAAAATPSPTSPSARPPCPSPSVERSGVLLHRRRAVAARLGAPWPFTTSTRGSVIWLLSRSVTPQRLRNAETDGTLAIG